MKRKRDKKNAMRAHHRRLRLKEAGLCPMCGKQPPMQNYVYCYDCRTYIANHQRRRQAERISRRFDAIVDAGLISVAEAEAILGRVRPFVHRCIKRGWLKVEATLDHAFYISEWQVRQLHKRLVAGGSPEEGTQ